MNLVADEMSSTASFLDARALGASVTSLYTVLSAIEQVCAPVQNQCCSDCHLAKGASVVMTGQWTPTESKRTLFSGEVD